MGTIHYIACDTCKVVRDLDKFNKARKIENRADAIVYEKDIKKVHFKLDF